jgi:hypothetical protein
MYQHLSLQDSPKFTQIGIFGFKIYVPSGNPDSKLNLASQKQDWLSQVLFLLQRVPRRQGDQMSLLKNRPKCGPTLFVKIDT